MIENIAIRRRGDDEQFATFRRWTFEQQFQRLQNVVRVTRTDGRVFQQRFQFVDDDASKQIDQKALLDPTFDLQERLDLYASSKIFFNC